MNEDFRKKESFKDDIQTLNDNYQLVRYGVMESEARNKIGWAICVRGKLTSLSQGVIHAS